MKLLSSRVYSHFNNHERLTAHDLHQSNPPFTFQNGLPMSWTPACILIDPASSLSTEPSPDANPAVRFAPAGMLHSSRPEASRTITDIDDLLGMFGVTGTALNGGGDQAQSQDGALPETGVSGFGDAPAIVVIGLPERALVH